jgi:hypothetical protein
MASIFSDFMDFIDKKAFPTYIDDFDVYEWLDIQTSRLRLSVQLFTDTDFWIEKTKNYRELLERPECFYIWDSVYQNFELNDRELVLYNKLLRETPQAVIPSVGPKSSIILSKVGIGQVYHLIQLYENILKTCPDYGFAYLCLYLRTKIGLDSMVYFRVALFTHIVSRMKVKEKLKEKQD